jgi:hypothetical protein
MRMFIQEKLEFRSKFAEQISITKLDYMFRVLKEMYTVKTTISDPDSFKEKIIACDRRAKKEMKRANST